MVVAYCGKCLCGAVRYRAEGRPVVVAQCHCEECRRLSGTGHSIGAMFATDAVAVSGTLGQFRYVSSTGAQVTRCFCTACGSPIYGRNTRLPGYLTLTLGSMDAAGGLAVEVVIFARDRAHWDQLDETVQRFATQPAWTPEG